MFTFLLGLFAVLLILVLRIRAVAGRSPHFVIGKPGSPYLNRWYVISRNRLFNVYLHQILRSDDDRALHDHPWVNLSIVLHGGYVEVTPFDHEKPNGPVRMRRRGPGSIVARRSTAAHRLEIAAGTPCWSLFITGPKVRDWGFWCPKGWKVWTSFVDMTNTGAIGPGCGDGPP
jgi:hypothetical protein